MCYDRRRAEACVDESAHHALANAGVPYARFVRNTGVVRVKTCGAGVLTRIHHQVRMCEAARQNCQTLTQSHLTPGNAPTASHARCRSPHCILAARDLKTGVCFCVFGLGLFLKRPRDLEFMQ
jgi:hypothetical protein